MFPESDLLPISALQHLIYCDRQCALIHIEQAWAENSLTVHGKHLHERADSGKHTTIGGVRIVRSLPLRSLRWGLIGKADVVEFRRTTGFQPVPNSAVLDDGSPQPPSPARRETRSRLNTNAASPSRTTRIASSFARGAVPRGNAGLLHPRRSALLRQDPSAARRAIRRVASAAHGKHHHASACADCLAHHAAGDL